MENQEGLPEPVPDKSKKLMNERLEHFGWALFLITLGILMLLPGRWDLDGTWLLTAGAIMIGLNIARKKFGIKVSYTTIVLGIIAFMLGIDDFFNLDITLFPVVLIILGVGIMIKSFLQKEKIE